MSDQRPDLWIGIALRGFGGDPPPHSTSLRLLLGMGFPYDCYRDDLFSRGATYVVLCECFSMPLANAPRRADSVLEGDLADVFPGTLERAAQKLRSIHPSLIEKWRGEKRELDIFVIVQTQAECVRVPLPAKFLATCNDLKLPIEVFTDHGSNVGKRRKSKAKRPK